MAYNKFFFEILGFCLFLTIAAQRTNYKYLGCVLEENLLSLGEESRVFNPVSPKTCAQYCSAKKYLFFILKNDTCYCSKHYVSSLMRQFDHSCTKKCSGDNQATCGGTPNFVSSYIVDNSLTNSFVEQDSFPIPIYLGCYSETPDDAGNRLLKGPAQPYTNNTPQRCSEICFKKGYLYFGVTYGTECWCGNQKPSKLAKVEDTNCNIPCSGDSKQFCGGGWKIGIYSTGITDHLAKKYKGCFENEEGKTKGKFLSFNLEANNSPRRCVNLCNTQRFRYATVKGNICECKNNEPSMDLKRSFSDCKTACPENPSERCGGSTTYNMYKTLYSDPKGNVKMDHIGCFNNLKRHPTLNGWGITSNRLTPKYCVNSCFARRFPFAALVSSKECLCSFTKPAIEAKTENSMCSTPCSGSSNQLCGGNNAIDVYSTGLEWKTDVNGNNYLGCFVESQNNRIFSNARSFPLTNTPEFCSNVCYKLGYTYSGVTYIEGCFCGSQPPTEPMFPKVEDKECNTKCSGDSNQFCGGGWRMGVFTTGLYDFPIEGRYIGCYAMQENILSDIKFELISTNVPSKCSSICNNEGYQFAGVTGINCFCGYQAPHVNQRLVDTECDTPCIGDSSTTCGGEDRIQIYDLLKTVNNSEISNAPDSINFEETFDYLNVESRWSYDLYIAQEPDYEFVYYNNSKENIFVKNGELSIKPTIQSDSFVRRGCLTVKGCTKQEGSTECSRNASSFNVLPPIISAKLNTKNNLLFQYGKLEIDAKLPTGDWIVSEIALISKSNEKNKLILASSFGNTNLKCNEVDESTAVLRYGLKVDDTYHVTPNMLRSVSQENRWSDNYHTFKLSRSTESIVFEIDGESSQLDTSDLPTNLIFDSEFYISIGVSVGGMLNFRDDCLNNGHLKPWKNFEKKAVLDFWRDKNSWSSTWNDEKSILRVKRVKFTSFETAQQSNYKFLGCFLEDNLLSLGEVSCVLNSTSPKTCSKFCSEKKYLFFTLKNETCHCNKHFISKLMKQLDNECTTKCIGDNQASCGGSPNLVSSYTTNNLITDSFVKYGSFPIPIYQGCYFEIPNDDGNRLLKGPAQSYNNNTPQTCSENCFKMGYLYFGVTYGSECWCGNQKPSKLSKVDDINCNSPCSGDKRLFCGGGWMMGIYSTGIPDFLPNKYDGCFKEEESNTKGKYLSFNMGKNNSPRRCMNLCSTQQFRYAAVKGKICECKNKKPIIDLKRHFSDCKTSCSENPSEYCGGSLTYNIYSTLYSDPQENVEMTHIGCFSNLKKHPTLNGWGITSNYLTPKYCVQSCFARRFPYAALVSSKDCLCSLTKPYSAAKIENSTCATPCSGSFQHFCGGSNAIDVYSTGLEMKTDVVGNYYLGCFEDSPNNRMFNNYFRSFPATNTPEFCSNVCYKLGYTYSGVTYIEGCFCGSQPPTKPMFPKVPNNQCNTKCSGDANQFCGGGWKMGVFAIGLYDPPIESRLIGCFIMQENILSDLKFELIYTNVPSICSTLCNNAGYQFAGVTGINCFCGNQVPDWNQRLVDTDCDTPCIGDLNKTCGGEDRIQIYDLMNLDDLINSSGIPESNSWMETFDFLNVETRWSYDIYIAQEPEFEFVVYNNSAKNIYVKNGELVIKPTIQSDSFIENGFLTLKGCTKQEGSTGCSKNASSYNILPPIVSAKLNTKNDFLFQYGILEVEAKLPIGDWIVAEIALISNSNEKIKLILATSFGNTNLKCNGEDESAAVIKYGWTINEHYNVNPNVTRSSPLETRFSDDYHILELSRTPEIVVFKVDGEINQWNTTDLPMDLFDSEFYLSIGVSVGGMLNFRDDCSSNGHLKPWKNFDSKALLNFWKDKSNWSSSWNEEQSILKVKHIKYTPYDSIN